MTNTNGISTATKMPAFDEIEALVEEIEGRINDIPILACWETPPDALAMITCGELVKLQDRLRNIYRLLDSPIKECL
jgi:hypothetical protein